jgi:hypothetical protein
MQTSNDIMLQMMMAQITDLQRRITNQDDIIASLKHQVALISSSPTPAYTPTSSHSHTHTGTHSHIPTSTHTTQIAPRKRPTIGNGSPSSAPTTGSASSVPHQHREHREYKDKDREQKVNTWSLSSILSDGEEVTIGIGLDRDSKGHFATYTTLSAVFDNKDKQLLVTSAPPSSSSLIGLRSDKPGVILYKFMETLLSAGVIKDKFSIAPWKLCSVVRDGKRIDLETLIKSSSSTTTH